MIDDATTKTKGTRCSGCVIERRPGLSFSPSLAALLGNSPREPIPTVDGSHVTSSSALHTPGWRTWTVWIVGVAAYVVAITNRTSLSSVGVDAAIRFDADASALSMFAVIQLAVYGSLQVPVGLILDRLGARPVIAAGMVLMAAGQLVMAFADAVGIGILARVLIGAGDAAVFPSVLRVIATWFPAQRSPLLVQLTGIIVMSC